MSQMKAIYAKLFFLTVMVAGLLSCGSPESHDLDTITQGEIYIAVDESLKDLISTGIYNFEQINPDASITPLYMPQELAYQALQADSIRLVIGGRMLSEAEMKSFENKKITPRYTPLAQDAVALIIGVSNPLSFISLNTLESWITGNAEANKGASGANRVLVFDHAASGAVAFLKDKFDITSLPANVYALNSNQEVVDYVHNNPDAIGILPNNWITQMGAADLATHESKVKYLAISGSNEAAGYFYPEQTYIADSTYPLIRSIYGVSTESRVGLGTGFLSFMASERGQRIILKAGLYPHDMPGRELIIHD